MDSISKDIVKALNITGVFCKTCNITNKQAVEMILDNTLEFRCIAHVSKRTLERRLAIFSKSFIPDKPRSVTHKAFLLSKIEKFSCVTCDCIKDLVEKADNYHNKCKSCWSEKSKVYYENNKDACNERSKAHYEQNREYYRIRNRARNSRVKQATPKWADLSKIKEIYSKRPLGYHVDHIIPLKGENVCGLHVHYNLQYLKAIDNLKKGNSI